MFTSRRQIRVITALLIGMSVATPGHSDIRPEEYASSCLPGIDDTACWQAAINAASPNRPQFGTVAGSAGKVYRIKNTVKVCNGYDGIIDGHGAVFEWSGPPDVPLFLIINGSHMRFQNLTINSGRSRPYARLESAFEFVNAPGNPDPVCQGTPLFSSKNSLDHVTIRAIDNEKNSLLYGVRFTSTRYGGNNANNDMSTIVDTVIAGASNAAVQIESTNNQSHQHRLISVNGYGAPGNNGCFVDAPAGFFSSEGGFQGNWGKAVFCVNGGYGPVNITDPNSENSKRLLLVGNPNEVAGYPVVVNIFGGRFAVNTLDEDGRVISFNRLGTLTVRGLYVVGDPPAGVNPFISVQPGRASGSPATSSAFIEGVTYLFTGRDASRWPTSVVKTWVDLSAAGNTCYSNTLGLMVACAPPLRN